MEPIVIAMGLAAALCALFVVYGAWLCMGELGKPTEGEPEDGAEADAMKE